jgi:hypothetical protein
MKKCVFVCLFIFPCFRFLQAQVKPVEPVLLTKKTVVDAGCGQCQFHLKTQKGCDLAVTINGKAYFVDGTTIDEHGDAHSKEGFCNAVRKAEVTGSVINNRFVIHSFKLLPVAAAKRKRVKNQSGT